MNKMQHYITDTLLIMEHIRQLISTNKYMNTTNTIILRNIAGYINRLLTIFGLRSSVPAVDDIGLIFVLFQNSNLENLSQAITEDEVNTI